jgi:methionyl-tRNA formyltransferase
MSIVVLADNIVGLETVKFLVESNENIDAIFLPPVEFQNHSNEIITASKLSKSKIFVIGKLWDSDNLDLLSSISPDYILSASWRYILPKEVLAIPKRGCINFHLSYLPYNRGKKPNVWPFIDGTPAGVTLHFIDESIDTGPIIARSKVEIESIDTAKSLYEKLINTINNLFKSSWPKIKIDDFEVISQEDLDSTFHYDKEFDRLDEIELDRKYTGRDLINILRARTFRPNPSAYFIENGKKVYIRIDLEYANERG